MGYELWVSQNTGIRRKGTTLKELQLLFIDNITTRYIYEPIYCCRLNDDAYHVKATLKYREFDIVGVINDQNKLIGYANTMELSEGPIEKFTKAIEIKNVISESTPISKLLEIFKHKSSVFVIVNESVDGIITIADINKPIVRMYLFSVISLFEMHLNFWINELFPNNSWNEILKKERFNEAIKIHELRKGKNEDLTLLECLQLSDKKVILKTNPFFIEIFKFSKSNFERFIKDFEKIRNVLAHSQNSIISNLEWLDFLNTISKAEMFLSLSEQIVEEKARTPNKTFI